MPLVGGRRRSRTSALPGRRIILRERLELGRREEREPGLAGIWHCPGVSSLDLTFASWPDEPYLVAELTAGDRIIGIVRWRGTSLEVSWQAAADIDLGDLKGVLARAESRLRDNRAAIDG